MRAFFINHIGASGISSMVPKRLELIFLITLSVLDEMASHVPPPYLHLSE